MSRKENDKRLAENLQTWDHAAANFDDQPDHGLRDPLVLKAWTDLLRASLPESRGPLLDLGCGTGSLSVVLAGLGFEVTGVDLSPEMLALARAKAARLGQHINFQMMDAAFPHFPIQQFDVIICRHLLWALPQPEQVLERWARLLTPAGCLFMIEGYWHTGTGFHSGEIVAALPPSLAVVSIQNLSDQPALWGGLVSDERFAIKAMRHPGSPG